MAPLLKSLVFVKFFAADERNITLYKVPANLLFSSNSHTTETEELEMFVHASNTSGARKIRVGFCVGCSEGWQLGLPLG